MNRPNSNLKALGLSLLALVLVCLGLMVVAHGENALAQPLVGLPSGGTEVLPDEAGEISVTDVMTSPSLNYRTVPEDFPHVLVLTSTEDVAPGYVLWSVRTMPEYLLITDNFGDPIYYKRAEMGHGNTDFKRLTEEWLSYEDSYAAELVIMDSTYTPVRTIKPGDPYTGIDVHDHFLLSNGNFMIEVPESRTMDMTPWGGVPTATVTAQVLQEIDPDDNVVWEWSSWDVFTFTDSHADLTGPWVDWVHVNSIEEDYDGNIIISSRWVEEVTKIERPSGDIIWRLGGANNEFALVGDDDWFHAQHDARRLPNGNLTIYDNRCFPGPCDENARGVEYQLDEANMVATMVWEFWGKGQSPSGGSHRRLSNGNSIIGWGRCNYNATEVDADNNVVFDAMFVGNPEDPIYGFGAKFAYRVVRYPWEGCPAEPPMLVAEYDAEADAISLYYSWNGATSVTEYQVYGGTSPNPTDLIATQPRTAFEDVTTIEDPDLGTYYFQVLPVMSDDCVAQYSNVVSVTVGHTIYLPFVANDF